MRDLELSRRIDAGVVSAEDLAPLAAAGAHHVAVSLEQSRAFLQTMLNAAPADPVDAAPEPVRTP